MASPATVLLPRARAIGTATALIARTAARARATRLRARRVVLGIGFGASVQLLRRECCPEVRSRRGRRFGRRPAPSRSALGAARPRRDESGQALPLALGGCFVLIAAAIALVAIAGAVTGKGRAQRAADLAAISAVRSMRDDLRSSSRRRACRTARRTRPTSGSRPTWSGRATPPSPPARRNEVDPSHLRVAFPDRSSFAPVRAKATVVGEARARLRRAAAGRSERRSRSRRAGVERRRRRPGGGERRRLQRPARLPQRRGDEAGRGRRLRPDGGRRRGRRDHPDRRLRLPLRRRTGRTLRRPSRPEVGRAAGHLAPPLRDRAGPRPRIRLRLDRRQCEPLRLRPALQLGGLAHGLRPPPGALLGRGQRGDGTGPGPERRPAAPRCRASSPPASATR